MADRRGRLDDESPGYFSGEAYSTWGTLDGVGPTGAWISVSLWGLTCLMQLLWNPVDPTLNRLLLPGLCVNTANISSIGAAVEY